jgi:hypothetical protein
MECATCVDAPVIKELSHQHHGHKH